MGAIRKLVPGDIIMANGEDSWHTVVIYNGNPPAVWLVKCTPHGTTLACATREEAVAHIRSRPTFCDECRAQQDD